MKPRTVRFAAALLLSALAAAAQAQTVKMSTSAGDIVVELDAARAPKTVENFLHYVKEGHYNGTIFHRVIDGFMIQGGGFTPDMSEKPASRAAIPLESRNGLANRRGTIAMARTMDPNSARAQFFINVSDNAFLDAANSRDGNGYAVFGRVTSGMDVVDRIKSVKTGRRGPHGDVPVEPVLIKQISLEK
ncbi:peptidylprolyl isomerase [Caldimonas tepidiphila]|uniref:peptidylprolyl isomerase n=1 Tax=Caldimonas tepidiphila TaxID=2315841 RepID=UPI000E5BE00E|nr:peptidylprolyl isomerase [Caldimonas tepidiphila]